MSKLNYYILGAVILSIAPNCLSSSLYLGKKCLPETKTGKVRTSLTDLNGVPVITQVSSYTPLDTDNDGKYDSVDVKKETLDSKGNVLASKQEKKKLEELTEHELRILKLRR